jgi:hypothetical protein
MSDSHGRTGNCDKAIESFKPDMILHLGDIERDVQYLGDVYPEIELHGVLGNNDYYCTRETEKVIDVNGIKIFMTHGHRYGASAERIASRAAEEGCTLALFGHTHQSLDRQIDSVRVFNPGSISLPRGGRPSCGILETDKYGKYGLVLCDWI